METYYPDVPHCTQMDSAPSEAKLGHNDCGAVMRMEVAFSALMRVSFLQAQSRAWKIELQANVKVADGFPATAIWFMFRHSLRLMLHIEG